MFRKYFKIILLVELVVIVMLPEIALAGNAALNELEIVGSGDAGPYENLNQEYGMSAIVGTAIGALLGLIGAIFLVLMIYAGYHWMTARGEEEKVNKAKDTITRAIIGLIIVVGAYAIWSFIFSRLF